MPAKNVTIIVDPTFQTGACDVQCNRLNLEPSWSQLTTYSRLLDVGYQIIVYYAVWIYMRPRATLDAGMTCPL